MTDLGTKMNSPQRAAENLPEKIVRRRGGLRQFIARKRRRPLKPEFIWQLFP
jgi:hypothetical protein